MLLGIREVGVFILHSLWDRLGKGCLIYVFAKRGRQGFKAVFIRETVGFIKVGQERVGRGEHEGATIYVITEAVKVEGKDNLIVLSYG